MDLSHVVVAYDVCDDKRRSRLARGLIGFLDRVQKSVFEGELPERRLEPLRKRIAAEIDHETDSARIYLLCSRCRGAVEVIGTGAYIEAGEDDIVF
jgi:CRISPR-associated protein Cas2